MLREFLPVSVQERPGHLTQDHEHVKLCNTASFEKKATFIVLVFHFTGHGVDEMLA